ncbi:unnamed protein product [Periconia digitata]|uniref:Uncharacterized protein n=1 Tax=Periconia digitata TaxID=1303443 RepID=A0A9W4U7E8_9PLEO|nr:unnamed protein product [Periconia digitata]
MSTHLCTFLNPTTAHSTAATPLGHGIFWSYSAFTSRHHPLDQSGTSTRRLVSS